MRRLIVIAVLTAALAAPAQSEADGGFGVASVLGGAGVSAAGSPYNWIAVPAGSGTVLEVVRRNGGTVQDSTFVPGNFAVAAATVNGAGTGLSADGRTLVLTALPRVYPPPRTTLMVLDARSLRAQQTIELRGSYSVDSISPTGRWLYLTRYRLTSAAAGGVSYQLLAYDLSRGRLLSAPIVDPRHPGEKMQGTPWARTMSADGVWAYTLYQSFSGAPFVHALDTAARRAYCIDLPMLGSSANLAGARLVLTGPATLEVQDQGATVTLVNTRTLAVRNPPIARPAPAHRPGPHGTGDSAATWALLTASAAALLAVGLAAALRRRRPGAGAASEAG